MKRVIVAVSLALFIVPFLANGYAQENSGRSVDIGVNPASESEVDMLSATTFGLTLARAFQEYEDINTIPTGAYKPSFKAFIYAYENQVIIWKSLTQEEPKDSIYMDDLLKVYDSGFLREYIWKYHSESGWEGIQRLKMNDYETWENENLPNHEARTEAQLVIKEAI